MLNKIKNITKHITMSCFGTTFKLRVEHDNKFKNGRIFLQVVYDAPCTKTNEVKEWHGRKWYLSEYMTKDEIIKTGFAAFKACVEHEVMEGYKFKNIIVFNPHVNFEELLKISSKEISRK